MAETKKAFERRTREDWFRFAPEDKSGIDIGCQNDPLNKTFRQWDLIFGDSDATYMQGVEDNSYHTVYASHVLEHVNDPVTAIRNWYRICEHGGTVIIVVPHRDLYERKTELPSRWNDDHKTYWLPSISEGCTRSLEHTILEAVPDANFTMRILKDGWIEQPEGQHSVGEYSIEAMIFKGEN